MDCEAIKEKLSCYADGELSPDDSQEIQRHIDDCDGCSNELTAIRRLATATSVFADVEPPRYLRRRIALSTVAAPPSISRHIVLQLRALFRPPALMWTAAGSTAAAAIIFAVFVSTLDRVTAPSAESKPASAHGAQETPGPRAIEPNVTVEDKPSAPDVRYGTQTLVARQPVPSPSRRPQAKAVSSKHQRLTGTTTARVSRPASARASNTATAMQPAVLQQDSGAHDSDRQHLNNDVSTNAALWNRQEEGISGAVGKSSIADVVAGELSSTAEDDAAIIRSLKHQLRMQKSGDGISVDVIDVRF